MIRVVVISMVFWTFSHLHLADTGYCYKSKQCSRTCYRSTKYQAECSAWWRATCTRYRSRSYTCYYSCSTKECCPGYTGSNCNNALCNGVTSCPNGGSCTSPNVCSCRPGFSGSTCSDINECATGTHKCDHTCFNTHGSYRCGCNTGYELDSDGLGCLDIDECSTGNSNCDQDCTNTFGSFTCSCKEGFRSLDNGRTCIDIDECSISNGQCSHSCDNSHGSYICSCRLGFKLDTDRKTCLDLDECLADNGGCDGTCHNTYGSYTCDCDQGYTLSGDICQDIDECHDGTSGCAHICDNTVGSYQCSCNPGYSLSDNLHSCEDEDDCIGAECLNGGICVDQVGFYTCSCIPGYEGERCEKDVDECSVLNGGCQDICVNTVGSYRCACSDVTDLDDTGMTCFSDDGGTENVFRQLGILGEKLPRGCALLFIESCPNLLLSSTSPWYRLATNSSVHFTFGIVFVELFEIALPISITGVEIRNRLDTFEMAVGVTKYTEEDGVGLNRQQNDSCIMFDFTSKQLFDFVDSNSYLKTMLANVYDIMPSWLRLSDKGTSVLSVQEVRSDILYGAALDSLNGCKGAPVKSDHVYNVFRFGSELTVEVYGNSIDLPKPVDGNKFCLIVDLCQGNAMTAILMLPPQSRTLLDDLDVFKMLSDKFGTRIRPRGIGFSLDKKIETSSDVLAVDFWNGENVFKYSSFPDSNLWIGADLDFGVSVSVFQIHAGANIDLYLGTPDLSTLLSGMFIDEWSMFGQIKHFNVFPSIKFDIFGFPVDVKMESILSASLNIIASIGGVHERLLCGDDANPPGVYMTFVMDFDIFRGIPILEDWVFSGKSDVKAFFATDESTGDLQAIRIDLSLLLTTIKTMVVNSKNLIAGKMSEMIQHVSDIAVDVYTQMMEPIDDLLTYVRSLIELDNVRYLLLDAVDLVTSLWNLFTDIKQSALHLFDYLKLESEALFQELLSIIQTEISKVGKGIEAIVTKINEEVFRITENYSGFGFRVEATINILGLSFPKVELEFINGVERLLQCSKYEKFYSLLTDEPSVKILIGVSQSIKVGQFVTLQKGFYSLAASRKSLKFVYHIQAVFDVLGMTVSADAFITNTGFSATLSGNIWNVFYAKLELFAGLGRSWLELVFNVKGELVAGSDKGPDFGQSYLSSLRSLGNSLAESSIKRLTAVQDSVTRAQDCLREVQEWFSQCQVKLQEAESHLDNAIENLETAKQNLEAAKRPYEDALETLRQAQKNVDNLCKIRSCGKLCIPGLKLTTCKRGWFRFPCLKKTSCMIRITDPACVLKNAACRVVRALAYVALEAAKIFVRIPMLAYDVAIAALSAAQHVVDASRIVLVAAEGLLEVAKAGVDVAIGVLEVAKIAVEVVKFTIRAGLKMFDFLIEYGLKTLIDVRNCGFELQLSTADKSMFEVSCELNPLRMGWRIMKILIDFRNPLNTIWYAAKNTINFITKLIENVISGRKRRDVSFLTMTRVHKIIRKAINKNDTLEGAFEFDGFTEQNNTNLADSDKRTPLSREDMFQERCDRFTRVHSFLLLSTINLFEMTNETVDSFESVETIFQEIDYVDGNMSNFEYSTDALEIDRDTAFKDYNLTDEDLAAAMDEIRIASDNDSVLQDLRNSSTLAKDMIASDMEAAEQTSLLDYWILGMDNETIYNFNETECKSFEDCVIYSFSVLYELFMDDFLPDNEEYRNITMNLEDKFLSVLSNSSKSIPELYNISIYLKEKLAELQETNLLCSTAPEILSIPENITVLSGSSASLFCKTSGKPHPAVSWFHNGTMMSGRYNETLNLADVETRSTGVYRCMAGNIVTNVTSGENYLNVKECGPGTRFDSKDCVPCEKGFYQAEKNKHTCIPCLSGTSTDVYGATKGTECKDINECNSNISVCHHTCTNTVGSYMCECRDRFSLQADGRTCKESGNQVALLIGTAAIVFVCLLILGVGVWVYTTKNSKTVKVRPYEDSISKTNPAVVIEVVTKEKV